MCINPTGDDGDLDTCESLVAEQKIKIRQLEEDLQQQKELCINLRAQLKAVENLVANLFQSFGYFNNLIEISLNVEPIFLNIETAIPCGLIINEHISNSLKYAFSANVKGEIKIDFREILDRQFYLSIQDNGSGFPTDFDVENTETLGVRLVKMLADQLDGEISIDSHSGTCYNLLFKELNYRRRI